jgi:hypothetical protein
VVERFRTVLLLISAGVVTLLALPGLFAATALAVPAHEIHHSEELKFKERVEELVYHSEGVNFHDSRKLLAATEARPRRLKTGGHAALRMWRTESRYEVRLSRVEAPSFWRHDWREWKRWNRRRIDTLHGAAVRLLAGDFKGFEAARKANIKAANLRGRWGRKMHLDLGG